MEPLEDMQVNLAVCICTCRVCTCVCPKHHGVGHVRSKTKADKALAAQCYNEHYAIAMLSCQGKVTPLFAPKAGPLGLLLG